jgi:mRNA interferase RelE/StbE
MWAMSYDVIFDPGALREFDKLPKTQQKRIGEIIDGLREDPRPAGAEKMTDVEAYKIRVGDFRVIYAVYDTALILLVVKVGNRRDIYKDTDTIRKRLKR